MLNMRKTLQLHERGDLDRRRIAHLRQVIASQVDEHHVFRQLLGILKQLGRQAVVLRRIRPTRTRTGDRIRPDAASFTLDEGLRRRTDNLKMTALLVGQVQEVHVGRRVDRTQHAIDINAAG